MQMQVVKWALNVIMGIFFLTSLTTGLIKFTLLWRMLGLSDMMLQLAIFSDIHDWSGLCLSTCVAVHLFLNRAWIIGMTKKVVFGRKAEG
jgi:hypothetical protein